MLQAYYLGILSIPVFSFQRGVFFLAQYFRLNKVENAMHILGRVDVAGGIDVVLIQEHLPDGYPELSWECKHNRNML